MARKKPQNEAVDGKKLTTTDQPQTPTTAVELPRPKMDLKAIALGSLVGQIHDVVVEFFHEGKIESVDIRFKQLSFAVTVPLHTRLNKGENVVAEWIALALVDEDGKNYLSKKQVEENFTQTLASGVFNAVTGLDAALKFAQGKMSSHQKTNSGAS